MLKRKRSSFVEGGSRSRTRTGNEFTPKTKAQKEQGESEKGQVFSQAAKKQQKPKPSQNAPMTSQPSYTVNDNIEIRSIELWN